MNLLPLISKLFTEYSRVCVLQSFRSYIIYFFWGKKNPIEGMSQKRGTYVDTQGDYAEYWWVLLTDQFPWK